MNSEKIREYEKLKEEEEKVMKLKDGLKEVCKKKVGKLLDQKIRNLNS